MTAFEFEMRDGLKRRLIEVAPGIYAEEVVVASLASDAIGNPSDAPWNGSDPEASLISILKGCYQQLATIANNTGV